MVKIKKEKRMSLTELLQYVWDNDIPPTLFMAFDEEDREWLATLSTSYYGNIQYINRKNDITIKDKDLVFKVSVEDDIDEDTIIPKVVEVYKDFDYAEFETETITNISVSDAIGRATYSLYMMTEEGTLVLLWDKDGGMQ